MMMTMMMMIMIMKRDKTSSIHQLIIHKYFVVWRPASHPNRTSNDSNDRMNDMDRLICTR